LTVERVVFRRYRVNASERIGKVLFSTVEDRVCGVDVSRANPERAMDEPTSDTNP
jgi:hypothetical protein